MTRDRAAEPARPTPEFASAWRRRYLDPDGFWAVTEDMSPGIFRDLGFAYRARRENRPDTALELLAPLIDADVLDHLWTARVALVQSAVLEMLGLGAEALGAVRRAEDHARRSGDLPTTALALHDHAVLIEEADAAAARDRYLSVSTLLDDATVTDEDSRIELLGVRALAAVNLYFLAGRTRTPLDPRGPAADAVQELADRVWPSLGHSFRSFRGTVAAEAGRQDEVSDLLRALPDPRTIRDAGDATSVAAGVAAYLTREGRHDEAIALLDEVGRDLPSGRRLEILEAVARVHEDRGDYRAAYEAMRERAHIQDLFFGEESRAKVRALEVWYRTDRHARAAAEAQEANRRLAEQAEWWRAEGLQDPLTGLWNRRHLISCVDEMLDVTGQQLAMIDLDRFKGLNDRYGHEIGDRALVAVARVLRQVCDPGDVCFRLGGDEFVVLRPRTVEGDLAEALQAAADPGPFAGGSGERFTLSIGVVRVGAGGFRTAFAAADRAMYGVKRAGGGAVRVADADEVDDVDEGSDISRPGVPFGLRRRHDDPVA